MFETKGEVTNVLPFSDTEDQITIQMAVPEPLGEEGDIRENDLVVPKGSAKVDDIVNILIRSS